MVSDSLRRLEAGRENLPTLWETGILIADGRQRLALFEFIIDDTYYAAWDCIEGVYIQRELDGEDLWETISKEEFASKTGLKSPSPDDHTFDPHWLPRQRSAAFRATERLMNALDIPSDIELQHRFETWIETGKATHNTERGIKGHDILALEVAVSTSMGETGKKCLLEGLRTLFDAACSRVRKRNRPLNETIASRCNLKSFPVALGYVEPNLAEVLNGIDAAIVDEQGRLQARNEEISH